MQQMLHRFNLSNSTILLSGLLWSKKSVYDEVECDTEKQEPNNGWSRLKKIIQRDKCGNFSPQLRFIFQGIMSSGATGFCFGSGKAAIDAYIKFIRENKLTQFESHYVAKRALQDKVYVAMMKGGGKLALRFCVLTTSLITIIISMNTYRGHESVLDFTVGTAAAYGIYKFPQGPKPAFAGSVIGAAIGTISGCFIVGLLKISGIPLQEIFDNDYDRIETKSQKKLGELEARQKRGIESTENAPIPYISESEVKNFFTQADLEDRNNDRKTLMSKIGLEKKLESENSKGNKTENESRKENKTENESSKENKTENEISKKNEAESKSR